MYWPGQARTGAGKAPAGGAGGADEQYAHAASNEQYAHAALNEQYAHATGVLNGQYPRATGTTGEQYARSAGMANEPYLQTINEQYLQTPAANGQYLQTPAASGQYLQSTAPAHGQYMAVRGPTSGHRFQESANGPGFQQDVANGLHFQQDVTNGLQFHQAANVLQLQRDANVLQFHQAAGVAHVQAMESKAGERPLSIRELLNSSSSDENDDVTCHKDSNKAANEEELAEADKPHHAERFGASRRQNNLSADCHGEQHSPAHGVHYPQAADPSKMLPAPSIRASHSSHGPRNQRPHFAHSHSVLAASGSTGYSAERAARSSSGYRAGLVARSSGDIAAAGEMRYRPYPDILASSVAEPAASNRPLLARAVSEALDPASERDTRRAAEAKRRRRTQACEYCHLKKVKCEGDGERCINCIKNDVQCIWGQKRKRGPKPKAGAVLPGRSVAGRGIVGRASRASLLQHATHGADDVESSIGDEDDDGPLMQVSPARTVQPEGIRMPRLDKEMSDFFSDKVPADTREAIRFYFDYFYPLSPMFHPSMFIRRVVHGQVDPILLDAMKATTARVITQKTGRFVDGRAIARSVKERILVQLEQPTVDLVRTLVAMTLLAGSQGEYVSYNSLICLAASLVVRLGWQKLDLYRRPAPTSWEEWVSLEVKRRLFWLVYQIDSYQAMLTGRPMSISEDSVYVSAPCSDYEWDAMHINRRTVPSVSSDAATRPRSGHQRSSRSSSGSATSLVQSMRVNANEIVATGAFSYSFMALCELTSIIAHINTFLCDAKASRPSLMLPRGVVSPNSYPSSGIHSSSAMPFPAVDFMVPAPGTGSLVHPLMRSVSLLSEYPRFVELDDRLEEWKRNLLMPEDLRDDSAEPGDISYFGTADHRRFMMRVRYFCLHCYYVPITIFLHQSNRPSFFTEYEQPLEQRLARRSASAGASPDASNADDVPIDASVTSEDISAMESDRALREMLNAAFADTWNEGVLAYDVEPPSWRVCVKASLDLSEHLERNNDFPLERFDQVIPFCIFMSVSVLIRQVRMCSRMLVAASTNTGPDMAVTPDVLRQRQLLINAGGYALVAAERTKCVKYIKQQWATLQRLGTLWDVEGMKLLLRSMNVDEVANAADLFSSMAL